jgi:uncharacterized membrane protein YjjP (DUF1212 family)
MRTEDILFMMILFGRGIASSGGSATDVERYIEEIGRKNGFKTEVASTPTVIHISIVEADGRSWSRIERIKVERPNFYKIMGYRRLMKDYMHDENSGEDTIELLKELEKGREHYSVFLRSLFAALAAFAFSIVFGGSLVEASLSMSITLPVFFSLVQLPSNRMLIDFLAGFTITILAVSAGHLFDLNSSNIIVGSIMPFVPGILITNSVLELANRNLVSGSSKLTEALLILASLVFGASSAYFVVGGAL